MLRLMSFSKFATVVSCLAFASCEMLLKPTGWPVETSANTSAYNHIIEQVKFTGSEETLTHAEKALLTFLDNQDNIASAAGKKNRPGSHQWSAAEVYLVDPGKHVSVLCENGYQQKAVYFHYEEAKKTWYRVENLEENHGKGVPAVLVKD